MTRHRRPEWGRPREACLPPRDMLFEYGFDRCYEGLIQREPPAPRSKSQERGLAVQVVEDLHRMDAFRYVVGPEGLALGDPGVDTAATAVEVLEGPQVSLWRRFLRLIADLVGVKR